MQFEAVLLLKVRFDGMPIVLYVHRKGDRLRMKNFDLYNDSLVVCQTAEEGFEKKMGRYLYTVP